MLQIREELLPKSEAGQAVNYLLKNWTALTRYCEHPDLSIDNNHTERSLRGWAVGRNNWTFFGSDRGGKTAAVLRSFVASCELVKVAPFAWFQDVLSRIARHPLTPTSTNCCLTAGLSRTTCLSFSMMTLSPATGTLRLGQVAGSDQFVALAAGAAGLWACTIVNTLTSNDAEINAIRRNERFFFLMT